MPIYEYVCADCQHQFEKIQKISESALTQCPECEHGTVSKVITAAGFRLGGNGWYETDFKTGAKKNLVSQDSK